MSAELPPRPSSSPYILTERLLGNPKGFTYESRVLLAGADATLNTEAVYGPPSFETRGIRPLNAIRIGNRMIVTREIASRCSATLAQAGTRPLVVDDFGWMGNHEQMLPYTTCTMAAGMSAGFRGASVLDLGCANGLSTISGNGN